MKIRIKHLWFAGVSFYFIALLSAFSSEPISTIIFTSIYLIFMISTRLAESERQL